MTDQMPNVIDYLDAQERFAKWQLRSARKKIESADTGEANGLLDPSDADDLRDDLYDDEFFFERYIVMIKSQKEHLRDRYPTHPDRRASRRR